MLGGRLFSFVDQRLKKLFNPNKLFGGISIIAFGDFNQLPPVFNTPIYTPYRSANPLFFIVLFLFFF